MNKKRKAGNTVKVKSAAGVESALMAKFGYSTTKGERSVTLKGINRSALADALGVNRSWMSVVLAGKARPGLDVVRRLAEVSGCSLDEVDGWLRKLSKRAA